MKVLCISNVHYHTSFSGINLTKGLNSGIDVVQKGVKKVSNIPREKLPAKPVQKVLNGPRDVLDFAIDQVKEMSSDIAPWYRGCYVTTACVSGDKKAIAKSTAAALDNTFLQPTKQAAAGAMAVKGAMIGASIAGPIGAPFGGAIGYLGTILSWGKARNALVEGLYNLLK